VREPQLQMDLPYDSARQVTNIMRQLTATSAPINQAPMFITTWGIISLKMGTVIKQEQQHKQ